MENNALTDHAYDGIQEYDNPLPGWWTWTFVATIVFSVAYWMFFHIGAPGRSIFDGYEAAETILAQKMMDQVGELRQDGNTVLVTAENKNLVRIGESLFKSKCATCHGRDGEGNVGPNLCDNYYKNVRSVEDIIKVINVGAANGAMPAWQKQLNSNEVVLVSAYVASLRNSVPPGQGKAPDGTEIPPWPEAVKPEATESTPATTSSNAESAKE